MLQTKIGVIFKTLKAPSLGDPLACAEGSFLFGWGVRTLSAFLAEGARACPCVAEELGFGKLGGQGVQREVKL